MPRGLKRFQKTRDLHYITFSCYRRKQKLGTAYPRTLVELALERVRKQYDLFITGYVVMPEHVHLLISEPERGKLSVAMQSLKQGVARRLALNDVEPFWQARYYDFNVWSEKKRVQKLRYIHRNPVVRELVKRPEDWEWSSYRHYATEVEGRVEIESEWTARKREKMGIHPKVKLIPPKKFGG